MMKFKAKNNVQYKFVPSKSLQIDLIKIFEDLGKDGWCWIGNDWGFSIFGRSVETEYEEVK